MEGVDHVHVIEVGGGGLVGQVDRMVEGEVPDGEGLELGITGLHAPLVLVEKLGEAHGHLAAAGTGGGDHHQGTGGFHIVVFAVSFVADDEGNIIGVSRNGIVAVDFDAQCLQTALEGVGGGLTGVLGHHHAAHIEALAAECVDEAEHVHVIGDAQVAANLVLLNIGSADGNHDLSAVPQLAQHTDLAVGGEAGQYPGGVVVIKELAAKLQIELAAKLGNALLDMGGLHLQILVVIKSDSVHGQTAPLCLFFNSASYYITAACQMYRGG